MKEKGNEWKVADSEEEWMKWKKCWRSILNEKQKQNKKIQTPQKETKQTNKKNKRIGEWMKKKMNEK